MPRWFRQARQKCHDSDNPRQEREVIDVRARNKAELTIISASLTLTSDLESDAEVLINGKVVGNVRSKKLTVGESAEITGSVSGETVTVNGTISGDLDADHVEISKTARITGDVVHNTLQVETGAYIEGFCRPKTAGGDAKDSGKESTVVVAQFDAENSDRP